MLREVAFLSMLYIIIASALPLEPMFLNHIEAFHSLNKSVLQIALVNKESSFLYAAVGVNGLNSNASQILHSTLKHIGPIGLFATNAIQAEYIVIKESCSLFNGTHSEEEYCLLEDRFLSCQGQILSHDAASFRTNKRLMTDSEVNWSKYDIVISMDVGIGRLITAKYPNILWAYYVREGCMKWYSRSLSGSLVPGQDAFLTQDFVYNGLAKNVIAFPWTLIYFGAYDSILKTKSRGLLNRTGFFTECHSNFTKKEMEILQKISRGKWYSTDTNELRISAYMNAKYYIIDGPNRMHVRGNQLAEVVAGGALIVGDLSIANNGYVFSSLYVQANSFSEIVRVISNLEKNNNFLYRQEVRRQRELLNDYAFIEPLSKLITMMHHKRNIQRHG